MEITQPFYLGATEVTLGQFRQFVEANPKYQVVDDKWKDPGFEQTDDHPVVSVTWTNAVDFCAWLSQKEGEKYRLPTEAEWESVAAPVRRHGTHLAIGTPICCCTHGARPICQAGRIPWAGSKAILGGFLTCTGTLGSCARTCTIRNTTNRVRRKTHRGRAPWRARVPWRLVGQLTCALPLCFSRPTAFPSTTTTTSAFVSCWLSRLPAASSLISGTPFSELVVFLDELPKFYRWNLGYYVSRCRPAFSRTRIVRNTPVKMS